MTIVSTERRIPTECELVCNPLGLHLSVEIDIPKKPHSVGMRLSVKLSYRRRRPRLRSDNLSYSTFPKKLEWCVMPNHVHVHVLPENGNLTANIVHLRRMISHWAARAHDIKVRLPKILYYAGEDARAPMSGERGYRRFFLLNMT